MTLKRELDLDYCPFCLKYKSRLHTYNSHGRFYRVQCMTDNCGTLGPLRYTPKEARDAWNAAERNGRVDHE